MMLRPCMAFRRSHRWLVLSATFMVQLVMLTFVGAVEQSHLPPPPQRDVPRESRADHNIRGISRSLDLSHESSGAVEGPIVSVYHDWQLGSNGAADQPPLSAYPSPADSTVLFLHVFKCAGTTLRDVFTGWALREGGFGATVEECKWIYPSKWRLRHQHTEAGRVCLNGRNELLDAQKQGSYVLSQKVLAGHFFWGFQDFVQQPHLMVTTLRNPLELMVSSQQFMHRDETKTLESATFWVEGVVKSRIDKYKRNGAVDIAFLRRLVNRKVVGVPLNDLNPEEARKFGVNAVENLSSFWLVGVVEQYSGFLVVLQHLLDPENRHPLLWEQAHSLRENRSPVGSKDVLERLDPGLVSEYNATIQLQWEVYGIALNLWDSRCREVMGGQDYEKVCTVPRSPTSYAV